MTVRRLVYLLLLRRSSGELSILIELLGRSLLSELGVTIECLWSRLKVKLRLTGILVDIDGHVHTVEHVSLAWHWLELWSCLELIRNAHLRLIYWVKALIVKLAWSLETNVVKG